MGVSHGYVYVHVHVRMCAKSRARYGMAGRVIVRGWVHRMDMCMYMCMYACMCAKSRAVFLARFLSVCASVHPSVCLPMHLSVFHTHTHAHSRTPPRTYTKIRDAAVLNVAREELLLTQDAGFLEAEGEVGRCV